MSYKTCYMCGHVIEVRCNSCGSYISINKSNEITKKEAKSIYCDRSECQQNKREHECDGHVYGEEYTYHAHRFVIRAMKCKKCGYEKELECRD